MESPIMSTGTNKALVERFDTILSGGPSTITWPCSCSSERSQPLTQPLAAAKREGRLR